MGSIHDSQSPLYRIGVDVGGTNTDAALVCINPTSSAQSTPDKAVRASFKSHTTGDITGGIITAIRNVIKDVPPQDILSVNIGTTHFVNAVVSADATKLNQVAVLRLCSQFTHEIPPFSDFPPLLRGVLEGYVGYIKGGLEIDGRLIDEIDEQEIKQHAERINELGITAIALVGVFSPLDATPTSQELQVKSLLEKYVLNVDIVCSRDIGRVGLLERENATILNASILEVGRHIIQGFEDAVTSLGLDCPLYLTQNDGTIMDAVSATQTPIKTFSSGATNSLMGAIFLSGIHSSSSGIDLATCQVIMVDIGGTTSDFAALSPSGFPRQSPATVEIGGVRTAFSIPDVLSIGLGGGSHVVQLDDGSVTVGPTSVGYKLPTSSLCFGGDTLTTTDIAVQSVGVPSIQPTWTNPPVADVVIKARAGIRALIQGGIDKMKTSDADVVLLLVGGGSIIHMDDLEGVVQCIRPPDYSVANAVGAAIAKVCGDIDRIEHLGRRTRTELETQVKAEAVGLAVKHGAQHNTVKIADYDMIPLPYMTNDVVRIIVKTVGELSSEKMQLVPSSRKEQLRTGTLKKQLKARWHPENTKVAEIDVESYIPSVSKKTGEWAISETDLRFIADGCAILGTGGGGTTYYGRLSTSQVLRSLPGCNIIVIDPETLPDDANIACLAWVGAPTVLTERLPCGRELALATTALAESIRIPRFDGLICCEIGGWNGFSTFTVSARTGVPIVDGDLVARAVPEVDMCLPYLHGQGLPWPAVVSDMRGNVQHIISAQSTVRFESMVRKASVELGSLVGVAMSPLSGKTVKEYCPQRSLSFAWFIGRDIALARKRNTNIAQALVSKLPGSTLLYVGRVVDVTHDVKPGWTVGTCTLSPIDDDVTPNSETRTMEVQFKNEWLYAGLRNTDGSFEIAVTIPDLITILDANGSVISTNDIRYGLEVSVIAMPAHPLWKAEVGINGFGPKRAGLDVQYTKFRNEYTAPPSVFKRYAK